jgi:hypothetical protein
MAWRLTEAAFSLLNFNLHEMNPRSSHNFHAFESRSMLPTGINMSPSPQDVRNVSDDRIAPQQRHRNVKYETTPDGDIVVVQPSFDDDRKTLTQSSTKEWQARSPSHDAKEADNEARNPSSPPPKHEAQRGHARNLSAHFFDATSLGDNRVVNKDDEEGNRKHRRMFSGDGSNPSMAHRRINSRGNVAPVKREAARQQHHHHREGSAGLDILSAAVDVTKDELAEAAGPLASTIAPWDPPSNPQQQQQRPSIGQVSTESYEQPSYSGQGHHSFSMAPPHRRLASESYPQQHPGTYIPQGPHQAYPPPHPSQQQYYYQGYATHGPIPPQDYPSQFPQQGMMQKQGMYPSQQESRPPQDRHDDRMYSARTAPPAPSRHWNAATHQGSQTFVTGLAVDQGNKTMLPRNSRRDDVVPPAVPSQVGHHRKLSSFSSLGTMFPAATADRPSNHHRQTFSSVSFLQDLDAGLESTDDNFLRNLQASNSSVATGYGLQNLPKNTSPPRERTSSVDSSNSGTQLASGGTSKRVRRKCTVDNCPNRVVQGGLCISHGAKRKCCLHPGCNKNVKKAGLCSTHGPARKRCDEGNCQKVAVQGGRCIAHGAKKKLCAVDDCTKQAILSGMCKKHHDHSNGIISTKSGSSSEDGDEMSCQETKKSTGQRKKPSHNRGLSIFQELSADAVSSMLNDAPAESAATAARPEPRKSPLSEGNPW